MTINNITPQFNGIIYHIIATDFSLMSYKIKYCTRSNFVPLVNIRQEGKFVLNNETTKEPENITTAFILDYDHLFSLSTK